MNDPVFEKWRELSWRRKLSTTEAAELEKYLAAHPEARADWEGEAQLNRLLEGMPEAPPVSSNFTALVMQAVGREGAIATRRTASRWGWQFSPNWLRRTAAACVVIGVIFLGYREYQLSARELMAQRVSKLAEAVSASGPDLFQNFDPIYRLGDSPPQADTKLLELMQ